MGVIFGCSHTFSVQEMTPHLSLDLISYAKLMSVLSIIVGSADIINVLYFKGIF